MNQLDLRTCKQKRLIYPLEYLDYPKYELNEEEINLVSNGMPLEVNGFSSTVLLTYKGELAAVAEGFEDKLLCRKVFL